MRRLQWSRLRRVSQSRARHLALCLAHALVLWLADNTDDDATLRVALICIEKEAAL